MFAVAFSSGTSPAPQIQAYFKGKPDWDIKLTSALTKYLLYSLTVHCVQVAEE